MSEPLTFETIKAAIDELDISRKESFEIMPHQILRGMQTIIKQGNKIYYSPDIKIGEVKVITFPENSFLLDTPKMVCFFDPENFGIEMHISNVPKII